MPGRAPLIGRLGYGELRTQNANNTRRLFVDGGFVRLHIQINQDDLTSNKFDNITLDWVDFDY